MRGLDGTGLGLPLFRLLRVVCLSHTAHCAPGLSGAASSPPLGAEAPTSHVLTPSQRLCLQSVSASRFIVPFQRLLKETAC